MTWREIREDQSMRLVVMLQEQQGEINALRSKLNGVRRVLKDHFFCATGGCSVVGEIEGALNAEEDPGDE
jgi:hypothetical protein